MDLGAFSVSLAVKDIAVSRTFYEHLGFTAIAGDQSQNWLILANGSAKVGLFQGMFEQNILTFNPGWSDGGEPIADFTDVRAIQYHLKEQDIALTVEADASSDGPAHIIFHDPDGNIIMLDQHVPRAGA